MDWELFPPFLLSVRSKKCVAWYVYFGTLLGVLVEDEEKVVNASTGAKN